MLKFIILYRPLLKQRGGFLGVKLNIMEDKKQEKIDRCMRMQKHNDDLIREAQEKIQVLGIENVKLQVEIIKLAKS